MMFTKQLVFDSIMCKDITLREKEFKAIALHRRFPGQSVIQVGFCVQNVYTVPSLAAVLSIELALRSYAHGGTLVRADRHPRPRENRHDRHPRRHVKL